MDIRLLKLITGEEVMGEFLSSGLGKTTIKNPVRVAVVRGQDGNPNVGFAPFPAYADEKKDYTFDFDQQHIVYSYIPAEDFCKNYEQVFGIGLVLPGEKRIITG